MGAKDYIQIEVPRRPEYVAVLRRVLEVVAVRARIPQGDLLVIRQVLGEACSRAVTVRAYTGHGDILRLRCTPAPGATVEAPAVLLVLEAPAAHFQCTVAGGAPDGEAGGVESESTDALSASSWRR